jgi:hypothetical protein
MTTTTTALGERAMLVSLSISIWSARKHDIRISDQVAADHGADRSMGRYAKHLIPRGLFTAVNAANNALRDHHNLNTLAWAMTAPAFCPPPTISATRRSSRTWRTPSAARCAISWPAIRTLSKPPERP